jgi:hypothetical protein
MEVNEMSIVISWLQEGHVILALASGILQLEALENADKVFVEMICLIQFIGSVAVQVAKARFRAFTDYDEAYNFLLSQDATLQPLENAS